MLSRRIALSSRLRHSVIFRIRHLPTLKEVVGWDYRKDDGNCCSRRLSASGPFIKLDHHVLVRRRGTEQVGTYNGRLPEPTCSLVGVSLFEGSSANDRVKEGRWRDTF